ncbi:hypothetical protein POVCU2_0042710 [Plasmodium ovale curtisi]|uniref:Uncharacterized protein n=1 Tax=Plasmodium ovale curtisi TaxID=864141 RepID=A0A1A8W615_PLAOA|nr:hypothetical protein POVCU2_0042710 [Plasmodium ovale curtisi]
MRSSYSSLYESPRRGWEENRRKKKKKRGANTREERTDGTAEECRRDEKLWMDAKRTAEKGVKRDVKAYQRMHKIKHKKVSTQFCKRSHGLKHERIHEKLSSRLRCTEKGLETDEGLSVL